ncbi:hypothetical protein SUDANB15_00325 [Streptomyces sp. enrichment culture]
MASSGSGWQQRRRPLPQVVRNKISAHPDTLPTEIAEGKASDSTRGGTTSQSQRPGSWTARVHWASNSSRPITNGTHSGL